MVCHSLLQWTTFCQTSPPWPSHLEWPHMAWLSFIELDKAVVCVIRLASFLWLWFVCLSSDALSQHLSSYLGFSYFGCGVSLHSWSSKAQPLLLTLDEGYLLMATPPDPERGVAPLALLHPCSRCSLDVWLLLLAAAKVQLVPIITMKVYRVFT